MITVSKEVTMYLGEFIAYLCLSPFIVLGILFLIAFVGAIKSEFFGDKSEK